MRLTRFLLSFTLIVRPSLIEVLLSDLAESNLGRIIRPWLTVTTCNERKHRTIEAYGQQLWRKLVNPVNVAVANAVAEAVLGREGADVKSEIFRDGFEVDLMLRCL